LALAGGLSALPGPVQASEPDTQKMIEALMPSNTRSLRNLVVRQKPEAVAVAASSASAAEAATAPAASAVAAAAAPVATAPPAAAPAGPPPGLALAIQFEPNSSRVRPESGPLLGSLVAALQSPELKGNRFIIEGHADARGAAERNQRLSQERADEVRLYLVALGVHPSRLRAVGRGTSQPVNPGDPAAAENRRVRVVTVE
jgi:outer membrane protein OmpA-like peptidoglycan-associated protein